MGRRFEPCTGSQNIEKRINAAASLRSNGASSCRIMLMLPSGKAAVCLTVKAGSSPVMGANFCGVEKWSSRLAHNQEIVGSNPTQRNQILSKWTNGKVAVDEDGECRY